MFEKEAEKRTKQYMSEHTEKYNCENTKLETDNYNAGREQGYEDGFQDGAEFGYDKGKEELTERLDNATEIIELMKDLFFDCWQEKGVEAIKFEQRVNDFLKGE